MFHEIYKGKRVLLTGHTGFKGSWLAFWLNKLGAELCGVSLPPESEPNHSSLLSCPVESHFCDIRNVEQLQQIFRTFQPEMVFHLAAQPLVRRSYREPAETFATNVLGTVNVLEACRLTPSVKAIVAVSSDKCYENRETDHGYVETDAMGGYDPYSASKGCTELVVSSYRRSFFQETGPLLASGRAGNVIGGGDWSEDRLVPDLVKAAAQGKTVEIRSPESVRPWQHVLESLSGYLTLGQHLLEGDRFAAVGWNFGPASANVLTVREVASLLEKSWPEIRYRLNPPAEMPHEAKLLRLDCSKAMRELKWHGVWTPEETIAKTAQWYRDYYEKHICRTENDWNDYCSAAESEGLEWIS